MTVKRDPKIYRQSPEHVAKRQATLAAMRADGWSAKHGWPGGIIPAKWRKQKRAAKANDASNNDGERRTIPLPDALADPPPRPKSPYDPIKAKEYHAKRKAKLGGESPRGYHKRSALALVPPPAGEVPLLSPRQQAAASPREILALHVIETHAAYLATIRGLLDDSFR